MSFLQDEDDTGHLEAILEFVDIYAGSSSSMIETRWETLPIDVGAILAGDSIFPVEDFATTGLQLRWPETDENTELEGLRRSRHSQTNPNRVRDGRQYELIYLREKVVELERELHALKAHSDNLLLLSPREQEQEATSTPAKHINVPNSHHVPQLWKEVADNQRRRRDEAHRENVRLRLMVERKRKMAENLRLFVHKQIKHLNAAERSGDRVLSFCGDLGEFHELSQQLDTAYLEIDNIFAANGLARMEAPTDDVHIRKCDQGKYLEFFSNNVFPFSPKETTEAVWNYFKGEGKHFGNSGLYEKAAKNLDQPCTIVEKFTKELFSNNSRADVQVKQVVRRYKELERDIVIFVSSVSPILIKHKRIDGLIYHYRCYAVTKPSQYSTSEHKMSLLQLCSCTSIDKETTIVYSVHHLRSVINFLIGNIGGMVRCYRDHIEDALADHALLIKL